MSEKTFKFQMHWPKRSLDCDEVIQVFTIVAQYPQFAYSIKLDPESSMSDEAHRRLAVSELKVRLIEEIARGEFVLVDA